MNVLKTKLVGFIPASRSKYKRINNLLGQVVVQDYMPKNIAKIPQNKLNYLCNSRRISTTITCMTFWKLLILILRCAFILLRHCNMWITKKNKATFHQMEKLFSIDFSLAWMFNLTVIIIITHLFSQYELDVYLFICKAEFFMSFQLQNYTDSNYFIHILPQFSIHVRPQG